LPGNTAENNESHYWGWPILDGGSILVPPKWQSSSSVYPYDIHALYGRSTLSSTYIDAKLGTIFVRVHAVRYVLVVTTAKPLNTGYNLR
jgi:hypothetical protein